MAPSLKRPPQFHRRHIAFKGAIAETIGGTPTKSTCSRNAQARSRMISSCMCSTSQPHGRQHLLRKNPSKVATARAVK